MTSALPAGLSTRFWRIWRPSGPIGQALQENEEWIGSWDGLGLYEGNNKIPGYQSLIFHLTTHRLLLEPVSDAPSTSRIASTTAGLSASLKDIRQTEFYTGFMRSSAKITLTLGPPVGVAGANGSRTSLNIEGADGESWACGVCGYRNAGDEGKCGLCGVGRDRIPHSRSGTPGPPSLGTSAKRRSTQETTVSSAATGSDSSGLGTTSNGGAASGPAAKIACPACTFVNHPSMRSCEICSTPLPRPAVASGAVSGTRPIPSTTPAEDGKMDIVRLSFRKGGEKVAYAKLKSVLGQKAWERQEASRNSISGEAGGTTTPRASGIGMLFSSGLAHPTDGILQTISLDAKNRSANVSSAFADLEVLMVRAGEMVKLAQSLNEKLLTQQRLNPPTGGADKARQEEEATLIRTSLVQLGLPAPALTSDMVRSDREYLEGLAKELGALLTGHSGKKGNGREVEGLMVGSKGRGVIGLDEVWGLWMRARGVALLSPSNLISILPFLSDHSSPPIQLRTLPSALKVLYSPTYSPPNILSRILDLLAPDSTEATEKSLSLIEIAGYEGLAIGLAKELMEEIERLDAPLGGRETGVEGIVRDDQAEQGAGGVRWYRDIISGWTLEA